MVQWGKAKCQRENPSNCQLPFLSHSPNHLLLLEIGWVDYCMGWERYDSPKFELEKPLVFKKHILTPWASKNPKTFAHSNMLTRFHVFLTIFLHVGLLEAAGTSCVCIHSCFWLFTYFSLGWEIIFVIISGWVSFPTILLHFPIVSKLEIIFFCNAQRVGEETHDFGCY